MSAPPQKPKAAAVAAPHLVITPLVALILGFVLAALEVVQQVVISMPQVAHQIVAVVIVLLGAVGIVPAFDPKLLNLERAVGRANARISELEHKHDRPSAAPAAAPTGALPTPDAAPPKPAARRRTPRK